MSKENVVYEKAYQFLSREKIRICDFKTAIEQSMKLEKYYFQSLNQLE